MELGRRASGRGPSMTGTELLSTLWYTFIMCGRITTDGSPGGPRAGALPTAPKPPPLWCEVAATRAADVDAVGAPGPCGRAEVELPRSGREAEAAGGPPWDRSSVPSGRTKPDTMAAVRCWQYLAVCAHTASAAWMGKHVR